jgi:hypothetical protein
VPHGKDKARLVPPAIWTWRGHAAASQPHPPHPARSGSAGADRASAAVPDAPARPGAVSAPLPFFGRTQATRPSPRWLSGVAGITRVKFVRPVPYGLPVRHTLPVEH